eukprot:COSAG01_NODE_55332_length_326_cov_0.409692_1_plen_52_part_01
MATHGGDGTTESDDTNDEMQSYDLDAPAAPLLCGLGSARLGAARPGAAHPGS